MKIRNRTKMLLVKTSIGALTAVVIGMIIKEEARALDQLEERYLPDKKKHKDEL